MKKEILERYEHTEDGEIIVGVSAQKVEDLYNDFDKRSHFLKKDLNEDLVDYLADSVSEIGDEKFVIQFNLETHAHNEDLSRVKNSIQNFFLYMQKLETKKMQGMIRTSLILLFIGLIVATLSILINKSELVSNSVTWAVIAEGLTVAAWVSLWEALATFLIKWMPYKRKISLYNKIQNAKIEFLFFQNHTLV
ncbi:MAG: hypothetical protein FP820_02405 [Sulfurimonas sp.]|jgi:uncharacterized protein YcgL (UPF0745 family)|nr:hypothetical protein [Sulfurimonas sp.]MBU1217870.1 hypothetical protein [bacterium]MBU1433331.1 hypothetical protein [bacterium]MBU1503445.1 hypothetical protein [bacterium]MBU3938072.1 hypothetical protein [bacterium]